MGHNGIVEMILKMTINVKTYQICRFNVSLQWMSNLDTQRNYLEIVSALEVSANTVQNSSGKIVGICNKAANEKRIVLMWLLSVLGF